MRVEEQHQDLLKDIEVIVIQYFRELPAMTDGTVMRVYEALIDKYTGGKINRPPRPWDPSELEQDLFGLLTHVCEQRLGRTLPDEPQTEPELDVPELDVDTLLLCLKRLRKSLQMWTKHGGVRGYLQYVAQFLS